MVTTRPRHEVPPGTPRRPRWLAPVLIIAIALVVVAGVVIGILATNDDGSGKPAGSATPTASATLPSSSPPQGGSSGQSGSSSQSGSTAPFQLGYEPLYPFANRAQVLAWEESHRSGGHQPWHLDAGMTAQSFVAYLGFNEIPLVTSKVTDSRGAHVGVGYRDPNGTVHTAAVLHLVRYGTEADAPWEVVGSDDTTFSLDTPAYGSQVSSPLTVGGRITGVDESIQVAVRQLSSEAPLGQTGGIPAGGNNQPWSATVTFSGASGTALTIVAWTGGHLQEVERFAIQGVHV